MNNVDLFSAVGGHGILGKGTLQNAAIDKIQIGWHPDVPVNSGFWPSYVYYDTKSKTNYISQKTPVDIRKRIDAYIQEKTLGEGRNIYNLFNSVVKDPMNQKINLALCAAHNMGSLKAKNTNDGNDARIVLRAMYKGTLESAALHGKKQVVLTLLGAGAFAGPYGSDILSWIVDALKENIDTIARYGLEITIVNYPDLRPHRIKTRHDALQLSKDMSALQNLLAQTNQKYTGQKGPQPTQPSALADKLKDLATALTNLANKLR